MAKINSSFLCALGTAMASFIFIGCESSSQSAPAPISTSTTGSNSGFGITQLDKMPSKIKEGPLKYPQRLYNEGIEGDVVLVIDVDTRGKTKVVRVAETSHSDFTKAARAAAEATVFEIPTIDGKPVSARFELPYHFRITKELRIKAPERRLPGGQY